MVKKKVRHEWLAALTFLVLLSLVIMQIMFLVKSAKLEQKHFNHRVVLALREARNEIAREANQCHNMHNYVCGNKCSNDVQYINFHKVDSIIQSNLYIHKIRLEYQFDFINENDSVKDKICISCYEQSLNGLLAQNGIKLQIEFPDQSKFVFAQLGILFYLSIAAIIFVMISFVIIYRMFAKEQSILVNTKYFIDNMVHEFQTPLANIKFATGLIKKKVNSNVEGSKKILQYASLIQEENSKLSQNVNDILDVVLLSSESGEKKSVNVHDVLHSCVNMYQSLMEEKQGTVNLELLADKFILTGDEKYLKHAFLNLLENAIKYTKVAPIINVKTYNKNNKLVIIVKDNGIGISSIEQSKVFEKYYRVSTGNLHDIKGFGLGLNFVKKVVDKLNGSIRIKSEIDKGSAFIITLKINEV